LLIGGLSPKPPEKTGTGGAMLRAAAPARNRAGFAAAAADAGAALQAAAAIATAAACLSARAPIPARG
jgi:hypothetical protein